MLVSKVLLRHIWKLSHGTANLCNNKVSALQLLNLTRGCRNFADSKMPKQGARSKDKGHAYKRSKRERGVFLGTNEDVLKADVHDLLKAHPSNSEVIDNESHSVERGSDTNGSHSEGSDLPERFTQVDVRIVKISSTGDGLGFSGNHKHVFVVPFSVPGDLVRAKVVTHVISDHYTLTDFVEVKSAGETRETKLVKCPYFSSCSGCQFQMMSYDRQLAHKKSVVERAYRHFSNLVPELIPQVQDTMPSPLQYGYRTKLTPHFDGPQNARKDRRAGIKPSFDHVPPIGFMLKGTRKTLDIEDCPIGTDAVRQGMKSERDRVKQGIASYSKGATLLLRENTERAQVEKEDAGSADSRSNDVKTCITDNNAMSREYIGDFVFTNPAGSFFQNNNSILADFTDYVQSLVVTPSTSPTDLPMTHLVDAYCGSGLFTICLSGLGLKSVGIDISASSIEYAERNALLNNLSEGSTSFRAADAVAIFADITSPPDQTVVIIDPPRKGCDQNFLNQLLAFGPKRLIYVSCNVHTQARDVAVLVEGQSIAQGVESNLTRYKLKSLRGLDFFPQTGHVESVALLDRV